MNNTVFSTYYKECNSLLPYVSAIIANSYNSRSAYIQIECCYCCWCVLTALQVWLSGESHLKGVLYWGGHNLVNFPSLASPLSLNTCTYLVLSNCHWGFRGCFQKFGFLVRAKTEY